MHVKLFARKSTEQRFYEKLSAPTERGCRLWKGQVDHRGYGKVSTRRGKLRAHRVAYELYYGRVPAGLFVIHSCANPLCCEPTHLRAGTHMDNMRDRSLRGRTARGANTRSVKLTPSKVREIRKLRGPLLGRYVRGKITYAELGRLYGTSDVAIRKIIHRQSWAWVY